MDKELLKEILSIPSYSGDETKLVNFITNYLEKIVESHYILTFCRNEPSNIKNIYKILIR
jgi:acetylornithine deacetylase/succinyl-diaminopimelate desuccinylase-like protein